MLKPLTMKTSALRFRIVILMILVGCSVLSAQKDIQLTPCRYDAKYGYADTNLKMVIPAVYDRAYPFYKGVAPVKRDLRYGLIDQKGNIVAPFKYHSIGHWGTLDDTMVAVQRNGKSGILNLKGIEIIPPKYDAYRSIANTRGLYVVTLNKKEGFFLAGKGEISPLKFDKITEPKEGVMILKEDSLYGLADLSGNIIAPPRYEYLWEFDYGPVSWYKSGSKYGHINNKGVAITGAVYDGIWSFANGFAMVKKDGKFGFINAQGKEIVSPAYDYGGDFGNGIGIVGNENRYAFVNSKGTLITGFDFEGAWPFTEWLSKVYKDKKWGYADTRGKVVIPFQYDEAGQFSEGMADVRQNGFYGYINKKGQLVIPPKYSSTGKFKDDVAFVTRDQQIYLINKSGKELNTGGYDSIGSFIDGMALCWRNGKAGMLKKTGEEFIPTCYHSVRPKTCESTGKKFYLAYTEKTQGLYDASGKKLLDTLYTIRHVNFYHGLLKLNKEGLYGYADPSGKIIIDFQYQDANEFIKPYTRVYNGKASGVIDTTGKLLIPFEYDNIIITNEMIIAKKNGKYGLINTRNEIIVPFEYAEWSYPSAKSLIDTSRNEIFFDSQGRMYDIPFTPASTSPVSDVRIPLNQGELHRIRSKANGKEYLIYVSLPFHYYETNKTYPVLYLADADQLQGTVGEATRMMAFVKTIPEVIVVGIAYGGTFEDWYSKRIPDLTLTDDPNAAMFPGGGQCGDFYRFLHEELIPLVEKNYRIAGNDRTFVGYSLGGLFGAWMLFNRPGTFNRYILVSPSLWWDGQLALQWEEAWHRKSGSLDATLYMSLSSSEWGTPETLDKTLVSRNYEGFTYLYDKIQDENHYSTFQAAFVRGVKFVFKQEYDYFLIR